MNAGLRRPVLLYDAGCRLCRWTARVVVRLDRRRELAILPMRDQEAASLLGPAGDQRFETWHLALPDGTLAGSGSGGVELLEAMSLTHAAGRALGRLPGSVLDRFYAAIARHRGTLGRLVPDGPAPRRFP